jgi:hypothetical protein
MFEHTILELDQHQYSVLCRERVSYLLATLDKMPIYILLSDLWSERRRFEVRWARCSTYSPPHSISLNKKIADVWLTHEPRPLRQNHVIHSDHGLYNTWVYFGRFSYD